MWFTDPVFGLTQPDQGYPDDPELDHTSVYRLDPDGTLARMVDLDQPNGIAFSPDESVLYVSQTPPDGPSQIVAFDHDTVTHELTGRRPFATVPDGIPDGFPVDADGRLWTSATGAAHVFASDGRPLGTIPVPGTVSNLALGTARRRLFLTGDALWGIALDGGRMVEAG